MEANLVLLDGGSDGGFTDLLPPPPHASEYHMDATAVSLTGMLPAARMAEAAAVTKAAARAGIGGGSSAAGGRPARKPGPRAAHAAFPAEWQSLPTRLDDDRARAALERAMADALDTGSSPRRHHSAGMGSSPAGMVSWRQAGIYCLFYHSR